jgi:hypothetical protein
MALSADAPRDFLESLNGGFVVEIGILASEVIYRGAACSVDSSGYLNALQVDEAFVGIAIEQKTGTATSGAETCKVQVGGVVEVPISGVTIAAVGVGCFATDDGTFTLANTNAESIGRIIHVPATGTCWVKLKDPGESQGQAITVGGA